MKSSLQLLKVVMAMVLSFTVIIAVLTIINTIKYDMDRTTSAERYNLLNRRNIVDTNANISSGHVVKDTFRLRRAK